VTQDNVIKLAQPPDFSVMRDSLKCKHQPRPAVNGGRRCRLSWGPPV